MGLLRFSQMRDRCLCAVPDPPQARRPPNDIVSTAFAPVGQNPFLQLVGMCEVYDFGTSEPARVSQLHHGRQLFRTATRFVAREPAPSFRSIDQIVHYTSRR